MELFTVLVAEVLPVLAERLDETPEPEDVKAGWIGLAVFLLLGVAVALLGWGLAKQLRRTDNNRKAGVFGPYRPPAPDTRIPGRERDDDADASADAEVQPSADPTVEPSADPTADSSGDRSNEQDRPQG